MYAYTRAWHFPQCITLQSPRLSIFSSFSFFASSWFKSPAICCNYSTELHNHRWEKIHKAAESRFQWLGNLWIIPDQNLFPTLRRHHQRYNHLLCYRISLMVPHSLHKSLTQECTAEQMKLVLAHEHGQEALPLPCTDNSEAGTPKSGNNAQLED